jgi:hypothetical protein
MVEMTFQLYESQLTPHYAVTNTTNLSKNSTNSTDIFDSFNQTSNISSRKKNRNRLNI